MSAGIIAQDASSKINTPATLAMLGGGQLGRFFVSAAHELGYKVIVVDPQEGCPAGLIADEHIVVDYDDAEALEYLSSNCVAATTEFENVPAKTLDILAEHIPVHPSATAVAVAQDRVIEKSFLRDNGFTTAPFVVLENESDFENVNEDLFPAILKIARLGYDGKGQARVKTIEEAKIAFQEFNTPCVIEKMVALDLEVSVVMARNSEGVTECFTLAENIHTNGILDISIVPARTSDALLAKAKSVASEVARKLRYVGVLAVEFFISNGELLVNEVAPRPHNSGHFTIDGCVTSQYEQQVRALCGLQLGSSASHSSTVMVNLLGDLWFQSGDESVEPDWAVLTNVPNLKVHLYGKASARIGRKMGHFVVVDKNPDVALKVAMDARKSIGIKD